MHVFGHPFFGAGAGHFGIGAGIFCFIALSCSPNEGGAKAPTQKQQQKPKQAKEARDPKAFAPKPEVAPGHDVATFGGGCFWCMETAFEGRPGIKAVVSGYMGGHVKRPSYRQVGGQDTGHAEVVHVVFDPKTVTYEKLLEIFWVNIDPTTKDRQFCDVGTPYRPEIFTHGESQKRAAEKSKAALGKTFDGPVVVPITTATEFYPAENYHQDYYRKNPERYQAYRSGCRRDARLKELWGSRANAH